MNRCVYILAFMLLGGSLAFAEPTKDRKDYLIEAYTSQRTFAQSDAASCYADASIMIAKLQAEIAELKAKLEPKKED